MGCHKEVDQNSCSWGSCLSSSTPLCERKRGCCWCRLPAFLWELGFRCQLSCRIGPLLCLAASPPPQHQPPGSGEIWPLQAEPEQQRDSTGRGKSGWLGLRNKGEVNSLSRGILFICLPIALSFCWEGCFLQIGKPVRGSRVLCQVGEDIGRGDNGIIGDGEGTGH